MEFKILKEQFDAYNLDLDKKNLIIDKIIFGDTNLLITFKNNNKFLEFCSIENTDDDGYFIDSEIEFEDEFNQNKYNPNDLWECGIISDDKYDKYIEYDIKHLSIRFKNHDNLKKELKRELKIKKEQYRQKYLLLK